MSKFSSLIALGVLVGSCTFGFVEARETCYEGEETPIDRECNRRLDDYKYNEVKPWRREREKCKDDRGAHYEWTYKGEGAEWKIWGDWLYQAPIHTKKILVTNDLTGDPVLGLKQFGWKHASGYRVHLMYLAPRWKFDLGYMTNKWKIEREATGLADLDAITDSTDYFLASDVILRDHTTLNTYEMNVLYQFDKYLCGMIGLSAITLEDKFNMQSTVLTTSNYIITDHNRLYGLQIGALFGIPIYHELDLNIYAKAGVYWNDVKEKVDFGDIGNTFHIRYGKNKGEIAYATEGNATLVYRPFDFISFQAGGIINYYTRMALGGKQVRSSVTNIYTYRKVHFHGYIITGFTLGASIYF